jgi:hypothetical protein
LRLAGQKNKFVKISPPVAERGIVRNWGKNTQKKPEAIPSILIYLLEGEKYNKMAFRDGNESGA